MAAGCGGNGGEAAPEETDAAGESGTEDTTEPAADPVDVRVGGGSPGSSVQVASSGIADMIEQMVPAARATVVATDGAGANVQLIEQGEVELATSVTTGVYFALNSLDAFEGQEPYQNVRMAFPGYTIPLYFVTTDPSIETWRDLEGKRLAMGPRGSGVSQTWTVIFEALEFDAQLEYIPYDQGNQRLADGQVDAHMMGVNNFPAAIEAEATIGDDLRWIGFTGEDDIEAVLENVPPLTRLTVDSEGYETLDSDLDTVGYIASLIAHVDVPDNVVYDLTETFVAEGESFMESYGFWPEAFQYDLLPGFEVYEQMGATVHDGYAQYWEDEGVDVPDAVRD